MLVDKFKLNFTGDDKSLYEYELRIPENLNWFIITRYNKENNNFDTDHLVYNGQIILYGYYYEENYKLSKVYTEYEKESIIKEFVYDLLKNAGINWITLQILSRLEFKTNYLKIKYWNAYFFNNIKYILKETSQEDEEYEKIFDIFINNNNENLLGKFYSGEKETKIEIFPNNQIDILRLLKSKK